MVEKMLGFEPGGLSALRCFQKKFQAGLVSGLIKEPDIRGPCCPELGAWHSCSGSPLHPASGAAVLRCNKLFAGCVVPPRRSISSRLSQKHGYDALEGKLQTELISQHSRQAALQQSAANQGASGQGEAEASMARKCFCKCWMGWAGGPCCCRLFSISFSAAGNSEGVEVGLLRRTALLCRSGGD